MTGPEGNLGGCCDTALDSIGMIEVLPRQGPAHTLAQFMEKISFELIGHLVGPFCLPTTDKIDA